jgi:hypothetical protein
MNCHLSWNLTHQKPSWNWIKLSKEVVDKILCVKRQVKPFVKNIYVTVLLFHYINVCNPNHPWRIWSKLVLLYFACSVCIKVFFFKKTQDAKKVIICPNGGVYFVKRSISSRNLKVTFSKFNHLGNLFFSCKPCLSTWWSHVFYYLQCIGFCFWINNDFKNSIILSLAIVPWSDYKF